MAFASLRCSPDGYFLPPCPTHQDSFVPLEVFKITPAWTRIKELGLLRRQADNGVLCPYSDCSSGGWGAPPGMVKVLCNACRRPYCVLCQKVWGDAECTHRPPDVASIRAAAQNALTNGVSQTCPVCATQIQ